MTMNLSKDGLRASHHEQKYFCSFCNFRTLKKYNLDVYKKNKHGTLQTISHHVSQEILHKMLYQLQLTIMYLDNARGCPQHTKVKRKETSNWKHK